MREDDGVALSLQRENGVDVLGEDRPFRRRNDTLDAVVKGSAARKRAQCLISYSAIYTLREYIMAYTYPEHNQCQVRESGSLVPPTARSASTA